MSSSADQVIPEIVKVREALWRLPFGRASVMIGSGFSRQAQAIALGARPMPTWDDLAQLMRTELGGHFPADAPVTDIAQVYQDRFGHAALDALILRSIPDDGYVPGENHRKLLALPWADVFTTNYDTLLERAALDTFNRCYEVVLTPADLPQRTMPRIIKLHGSFPATRPFIITAGEYAGYEKSHGPFVNLARQATMETVFLLLGFSGDDPNFQAWTSWVQKELGPYAPQIYLCNVLDLSPGRRAALQDRRVTPIDLGPLFPETRFPERDTRRIAAMTWLLETFARGKPGRPTEWAPWDRRKLEPLVPEGAPEIGYTAGYDRWPNGESAGSPDKLRELAAHWRKQRLEYPGYVVAPSHLRDRIWHHTHMWRQLIFRELSRLTLIDQLQLAREFAWRFELCLMSLGTNEAHVIADLLEQFNPFRGTLELPASTAAVSDSANYAELWIELALAVLRTAREDFEEERYAKWRARLDAVAKVWPSLQPRLDAETAYWALAQLDLTSLEKHLKEWRSREKTPWGFAQLAAIMTEFGHCEAAYQLATETLQVIRRHLRAAEPRYDLLSLEAWLICLLELLRENPERRQPAVRDRTTELERLGCNPEEIRERLQTELESIEPPLTAAERNQLTFDPGDSSVTTSMHGGGADAEKLIPAFTALRLSEMAPVALRRADTTYLSHEVARAAIWLETAAPMWALAFVVRTNDNDAIKRFMDRAMVATMSAEYIACVWKVLLRPVELALVRLETMSPDREHSMVFAMADASMQLLSRLAFQLNADRRQRLLDLLIRWLNSKGAAKSWIFQDPVRELTGRLFFALEPSELTPAALRLLEVPVAHEHGFEVVMNHDWVEPVDEFGDRPDWLPDAVPVPDALVYRLANLLRSGESEASRRAMRRLLFLVRRAWLSEAQQSRFQDALWSRVSGSGLPEEIGHLRLHAWRSLPAPDSGLVDRCLRAQLTVPWEPLRAGDGRSFHTDAIASLATHCDDLRYFYSPLFRRPPQLDFQSADAVALLEAMTVWWAGNSAAMASLAKGEQWQPFIKRRNVCWLAEEIVGVIGDVVLASFPRNTALVQSSFQLLEQISHAGFSTTRATVGLLLADVISPAQARMQVSDAIVGQDEQDLHAGGRLLLSWMRCHQRGLMVAAPSELTELLATRATVSEELARGRACYWLSTIVQEFGDGLTDTARRLLAAALSALLEQTDLERWLARYRRGMAERTEGPKLTDLRASAAQLAGALCVNCQLRALPEPGIVGRWRSIAETDPLPEVRRAWKKELDVRKENQFVHAVRR